MTKQDAPRVPTTRGRMVVAGATVAAVGVLGGLLALALWSRTASTPAKIETAVPDRPEIAKTPGPTLSAARASDAEVLLESTWQAIRAREFADARKTLNRYLDDPQAAKQEEARMLLADLDRATSKTEARDHAKGLGNDEAQGTHRPRRQGHARRDSHARAARRLRGEPHRGV